VYTCAFFCPRASQERRDRMSTKAPLRLRKFTVRIRPHEAEAVEAFVERMGIPEAEFLRACVYASVRGE
jgi:hypothetical protein